MKKRSHKILDIMSFFGIALLVVFVVLAVNYAYSDAGKPIIYYIVPYLTLVLGCLCFIFTLIYTKKAYHMFISILLFAFGCIFTADLIWQFSEFVKQLWPVFGIITGLAWLISGIYKYKRFNLGYTIPSLVLILFGCWYMLFTFKIIKFSFIRIVIMAGPVFVLMLMAFMIGLYFGQKKYKQLIIQNEEPEVFADEEMVLTDMEADMDTEAVTEEKEN